MASGVVVSVRSFTLIELLIVVAIISILATIAVPNFLEAQTRSKAARVRAELRSLATSLETYRVDQNAYPSANSNGSMKWMRWLSTPVAYIARADLADPFTGKDAIQDQPDRNLSYPTYRYFGFNEMGYVNADSDTGRLIPVYAPCGDLRLKFYLLFSHGPDRVRSKASNGRTLTHQDCLFHPERFAELVYDPTNGTLSNGEMMRAGGEPTGRAAASILWVQRQGGY